MVLHCGKPLRCDFARCSLALLGPEWLPAAAPGYALGRRERSRQLVLRQAEALRAILLKDQEYMQYLPPEDRWDAENPLLWRYLD